MLFTFLEPCFIHCALIDIVCHPLFWITHPPLQLFSFSPPLMCLACISFIPHCHRSLTPPSSYFPFLTTSFIFLPLFCSHSSSHSFFLSLLNFLCCLFIMAAPLTLGLYSTNTSHNTLSFCSLNPPPPPPPLPVIWKVEGCNHVCFPHSHHPSPETPLDDNVLL